MRRGGNGDLDSAGLRLRVGGFRIIFARDDEAGTIDVLQIAPRGEVYK